MVYNSNKTSAEKREHLFASESPPPASPASLIAPIPHRPYQPPSHDPHHPHAVRRIVYTRKTVKIEPTNQSQVKNQNSIKITAVSFVGSVVGLWLKKSLKVSASSVADEIISRRS